MTGLAVVLAVIGARFGHPGHRPLRLLLFVLFIALVVAVVWLIVREVRQRRTPQEMAASAVRAPAPLPGYDDALEQLRLRYVRGEIERDEYLQKVEDLGGTPPA